MHHLALLLPSIERIAGAERQVLLLAQGMARRGWRVTLMTLSGGQGAQSELLRREGIAFYSLAMSRGIVDPRGWIRFFHWICATKPDIVHAHLHHAVWLSRWARLLAPVPVLIDTIHSVSTGGWSRKFGYRSSRWLTDCVTAVSSSVEQSFRDAAMVSAHNLIVLPNAVDTRYWHHDQFLRLEARQRIGIQEQFLWFAAGRLEPVKDYPTMLLAMRLIPEAHLAIAGCGPSEAALKQLAVSLGVDGRVHFLGFQSDLRPWYSAADAIVHASLYEGLPLVLLEAAACALPAVATDVPGTREAVLQGKTGLLTLPQNADALADAMKTLMQLPAKQLQSMAENARTHVVLHFHSDDLLARWESLYVSLLAAHPRPSRWQHGSRYR